jgi:hypothetical protein
MNRNQKFDLFVNMAREQAEGHENRREAQIRLFLFAIEIGQKRKLTSEERSLYEKTYLTAQLLSGIAHGDTPAASFDRVAAGGITAWLEFEPQVRTWLERALGHNLDEANRPPTMSPELREMVVEGLSMLYGSEVSKADVAEFIDRLEHPLDRA